MQLKEYKIEINAIAEKVWFALWDDFHYRIWTSAFCDGSYAVSDNWKEGSKVHFLTPDGKGMYSTVVENKPLEKMVFGHIGNIDSFKELPLDDETNQWTGSKERYTLSENNGVTTLVVAIDIYEKYMEYFDSVFPKALEKLKTLTENFYITVQSTVNASIDKIWEKWNNPKDITQWCIATDSWHTPTAENDLRIGGKLKGRMEAKDGSMGFDFMGTYSAVEKNKRIEYAIEDGRKVKIIFESDNGKVKITESFEAESANPFEMQRDGWQAILNKFKKYTENE